MKRYKDERLELTMNEMQAKLFRYLFLALVFSILLKNILEINEIEIMSMIDNIIVYSTIIYAGILQFKAKTDFYEVQSNQRETLRFIGGAIFVGTIVMLKSLVANNLNLTTSYLLSYILTFLNGVVLYAVVYAVTMYLKKKRHEKFNAKLEEK